VSLREHGARRLTPVANSLGSGDRSAEPLLENGQVSSLIVSFSARPGMDSVAERLIASGQITLQLVPQGVMVERVRAAAAGLAAFYSATGVGHRSLPARNSACSAAVPMCWRPPCRSITRCFGRGQSLPLYWPLSAGSKLSRIGTVEPGAGCQGTLHFTAGPF
jgi:hypothetical protein